MNLRVVIRIFDKDGKTQDEEVDLFPEHRSLVCLSMLLDYGASTAPESPERDDRSSHPDRYTGGQHT